MRFGGRSGLEILAEDSDPALLMELDTYWVAHGGGDPCEWIRRLAGRVPFIHVKDMVIDAEGKQAFAEVGQGNLNWPGIVDAARAAGTRWYIVEQDRCPGPPVESLKISLENLNAWGVG